MVLRSLIVEENQGLGIYLKKIIEEVPNVSVVDITDNSKDALKQIEMHQIHVMFMDIDMSEMDGIESAREIIELEPDLNVIFISSYPDYTLEAFELYCYDYILKPFDQKRIKKTVRKLKDKVLKEKILREKAVNTKIFSGFFIDSDGRSIFLNYNEIIFIESRQHKVFIKSVKGDYLTKGDLTRVTEKLDPQIFFRSHKGYIVNLMHLKEVVSIGRTFEIILRSGDKVLLSRTREKVLRDKFKII